MTLIVAGAAAGAVALTVVTSPTMDTSGSSDVVAPALLQDEPSPKSPSRTSIFRRLGIAKAE